MLAAAKLLNNDHALETIPAVKRALALETVPQTRNNIAFALAQVGDHDEFSDMQRSCNDAKRDMSVRL
jgi:hypothetical protein